MTRIVVAGHGMAGSRFVQELRARDPQRRLDVTVVGAEPQAAYNRVLLSSVLAGSLRPSDVEMIPSAWYAAENIDLRLGTAVEHIDRRRQRILTAAGEYISYDHLVLATGSRPWVPPLDGVVHGEELDPDVAVFRTLDDCRRILARVPRLRRAVVLGGGLLGLEAARGLAGRGVEVEVVHPVDRLMERQLDQEAGRVLSRTLTALGVRIRLQATAVAYDEAAGQRVLVLDDGTRVAADLLVVACGVRPNVALARAARLEVDRGVVVDDQLTSVTDSHVHAIGECAQHDGQVYGLVAPAWEQAQALAGVLTGQEISYAGSPLVTRLKAADVDLAAMGDTDPDGSADGAGIHPDEPEVLRFTDPARGMYQKVVIRDGRVTGAIMLGGPETVGTITQLFDRSGLVPVDRRALFFPGLGGAAGQVDPARLGDDDIVCRCNSVTAGQIRQVCRSGVRDVPGVAECTRATTGCGGCRDTVAGLIEVADSGSGLAAGDDGMDELENPDDPDEAVVPDRADDTDVATASGLVEVTA